MTIQREEQIVRSADGTRVGFVKLGSGPALVLVHGILHLLGHDHAEPDETAAMQRRERELLDRHHRS